MNYPHLLTQLNDMQEKISQAQAWENRETLFADNEETLTSWLSGISSFNEGLYESIMDSLKRKTYSVKVNLQYGCNVSGHDLNEVTITLDTVTLALNYFTRNDGTGWEVYGAVVTLSKSAEWLSEIDLLEFQLHLQETAEEIANNITFDNPGGLISTPTEPTQETYEILNAFSNLVSGCNPN